MSAVSEPVLVRLSSEPLSVEDALAFIADPGAGGTCVFVGTVRDRSDAGDVTGLHYEAWDDLATERLREIAAEMLDRWPLRRVAILHRTGDLAVGDASVVVACSAAAPRRGLRGLPARDRTPEGGRADLEEGGPRVR